MAQVVPLLIIIPDWSYRPSPFYHCNDKVFYLKLQEFRTPGSKIRKLCRVATKRHAWGALDGAQIKFIEFPWANAKALPKGSFLHVSYSVRCTCIQLVKAQDVEVVVFYPIILLSCPASTRTCIYVPYPLSYGGCALYIPILNIALIVVPPPLVLLCCCHQSVSSVSGEKEIQATFLNTPSREMNPHHPTTTAHMQLKLRWANKRTECFRSKQAFAAFHVLCRYWICDPLDVVGDASPSWCHTNVGLL